MSPELADHLDTAYFAGLRSSGVSIRAGEFRRGMLLFAAHRLLWTLSWNMEALFNQDREIVPGVSTRQTLLQYLRDLAEHLETRLAQLWPNP